MNHIDALFSGGTDATGGSAAGGGSQADAGATAGAQQESTSVQAEETRTTEHVETTEEVVEKTEEQRATVDGAGEEKPVTESQASDATNRIQAILEANGFDSIDELEAELKDGLQLKDLIGSRDANKLIEDADTLDRYKQAWAQEELNNKIQNESLEEKAARLEKENTKLKENIDNRKKTAEKTQAASEALITFSNTINKVIDNVAPDLDEGSREIAALLLGVDNPMDDISDIANARVVRPTATNLAKKFSKFVSDIQQKAIDDYAAGKSKIKPVASAEQKPVVQSVERQGIVTKKDDAKSGFFKAGEALKSILRREMGS